MRGHCLRAVNVGARFVSIAVFVILSVAGCGRSGPAAPKTYPASGKVVFKEGQPLKGGSIQLLSASDPNVTINGAIRDDGTFTLDTLVGNTKHAGAPAGDHDVIINPPQDADQTSIPIRVVTTKQKIAAGPNNLTIEIEKLPK